MLPPEDWKMMQEPATTGDANILLITYIDHNAFNDAFYLFYSSDSKQNTQTLFAY
jgi:hypothetical protein